MENKDKKNKVINFRCTSKEYDYIQEQAKKKGLSVGDYLLNEHLPRRFIQSYKKKILPAIVNIQQASNELTAYVEQQPNANDHLKKISLSFAKGVDQLWES